jgi:ATP-dependent exoDNAse (exonuclease V) beta subunit
MEAQEKIRLLYVAATRARDHLVVSLHHKQGRKSHAALLTDLCTDAPELVQYLQLGADRHIEEPRDPVAFDDSAERLAQWKADREERIAANARVPVVAATEIARGAGAAGDPNLQKEPPVEEVPPWRRGRAGTAVGRAVHAVLQSIDLASGEGVDGAARAQAAAEGIPNRADAVARMVRAALSSATVRQAVGGRYWRELYVAAPVDGKGVEGFVDLLYETPEGLVVVDYKTDAIPKDEVLDDALARYRLQGAAYALALEEALQRNVARCVFLFVQPRDAVEREIEDLRQAIDDARGAVAALEYAGVERDAGTSDEVDDDGVHQVRPLEVERVAEPREDAQLGLWDQVGEDR